MDAYRRKARVLPASELYSAKQRSFNSQKLIVVWKCLLLLCSIIACLVTPIIISIVKDATLWSNPAVVLGLVCDLVFACEFLHKLGTIISSFYIIRTVSIKHYAYSDAIRCFISCSPLFLVPLFSSMGPRGAWATLPRLIVLHGLLNQLRALQTMVPETSSLRSDTVSRVVLAGVFASLYASALACIWFYIACHSGDCKIDSWVNSDEVLVKSSYLSCYVRSLYFVIQTLFTIGYGDIDIVSGREIVFSLFLMLNGSLFYGFLISAITSFLMNKDVVTKRYRNDMALIRTYAASRDIPERITTRLTGVFEYMFSRQGGMLEKQFLEDFPPALVRELKQTYASQLQQNSSFFQPTSARKLSVLCAERLEFKTYAMGTTVVYQHEKFRDMILIRSGRLELWVTTASKRALFALGEGDTYGEFQMIFGTAAETSVIAPVITEVAVLSYESFCEAVERCYASKVENVNAFLKTHMLPCLSATVEAHKGLLDKISKLKNSVEENKTKKKFQSIMMADDNSDNVLRSPVESGVILPDSLVKPIWYAIAIIGIIYYSLAILLRVMLMYQCDEGDATLCLSQWNSSLILDYMFDIFFVADIYMHCCKFAYTDFDIDRSIIVTDRRLLTNKYLESKRCMIAIIAVLPWDVLSLWIGGTVLLRLPKLLWMLAIFDAISDLLKYFEECRKRTLLSTEGVTILHLSLIVCAVALWLTIGWAILHNDGNDIVASAYWCLTTMTTVGYGDILPESTDETLFVILACVLGPCACATIIGNVASFVHSISNSATSIEHKQTVMQALVNHIAAQQPVAAEEVNNALVSPTAVSGWSLARGKSFVWRTKADRRGSMGSVSSTPRSSVRRRASSIFSANKIITIPEHSKRALEYLRYVATDQGGVDDSLFLDSCVPDCSKLDILANALRDVVASSPLFSDFAKANNSGLLRNIISALERQVFPSRTVVASPGVPLGGMYLLRTGTLQIYTAQGRKTHKLSNASSFGEIFLFDDVGFCNFRAVTCSTTELWFLSKVRFQDIMRAYLSSEKDRIVLLRDKALVCAKSLLEVPIPKITHLELLATAKNSESEIYYVLATSDYMQLWTFCVILFSVYNLLVIPFRLAFFEGVDALSPLFAVDFLGDIVFFADIILRMFFLVQQDVDDVLQSRKMIFANYTRRGGFVYHALATLPLDLVVLFGNVPSLSVIQTLSLLRSVKLFRLVDLGKHMEKLELLIRTAFNNTINNAVRIAKLIMVVIFAAHIAGCLFFLVGNTTHRSGKTMNWGDDAGILRHCTLGIDSSSSHNEMQFCYGPPSNALIYQQYIRSLYWATATLTTVGYGDITGVSPAEHVFSMIVFVVGTLVYALVIASLQNIVSQLDVTSDIHKNRTDRLKAWMVREKVTDEFKRKMSAYLDMQWMVQRGATGIEAQSFVPEHLYSNIVVGTIRDKFDTMFFLRQSSIQFRADVAATMVVHSYMAPDFIFHTGEAAQSLYILISGEVSFVNENSGQHFSKLFASEGVLGASEFFCQSYYSCAAQASTDVVCLELKFSDFWRLVCAHHLQDSYSSQLQLSQAAFNKASTANLVNTLKSNLKNSKMTKMLVMPTASINKSHIIYPNSAFAKVWTVCTMCLLVYTSLTVPYFIAFPSSSEVVLSFDVLCWLFFAADMFLSLRHFAIEENGVIISEISKFSKLYMERRFKMAVIALLPLAIGSYFLSSSAILFAALRIFYLSRLTTVSKYLRRTLTVIESFLGKRIPGDALRIIETISLVWYIGHIAACMFCCIGLYSVGNTWIDENGLRGAEDFFVYMNAYLFAIYTIITVGYGNISLVNDSERVFAIGVMIFGAILCDAGVVAVVGSMVSNADKQNGLVRRSAQAMSLFCTANQMSESVKAKIAAYVSYLTNDLGSSPEIADMSLVPKPLMLEFVQSRTLNALCSLCLFDVESPDIRLGFVYSVTRLMTPTLYLPGQVILAPGDADVHVLRRGRAFAALNNGRDYFQEGDAICREGRVNTATIFSPSKLVTINITSFLANAKSGGGSRRGSISRFGGSSMYVRLQCGARKARTSVKSCIGGCAQWNETIELQVPRGAETLQVLIFDEKQVENGGCVGKIVVSLNEFTATVRDTNTRGNRRSTGVSSRNQVAVMETLRETVHRPSQARNKIPNSFSIDEMENEELTEDEDAEAAPSLHSAEDSSSQLGNFVDEDIAPVAQSVNVNGDVLDKTGAVKGRLLLQVSVKDAGSDFACGTTSRKCSLNRSLSLSAPATSSVEVIAESMCHLFSIDGAKLRELRRYYSCLSIDGVNTGKNMYMKFRSVNNRRRSSFSVAGLTDKLSSYAQDEAAQNKNDTEVVDSNMDDNNVPQRNPDDDEEEIVADAELKEQLGMSSNFVIRES